VWLYRFEVDISSLPMNKNQQFRAELGQSGGYMLLLVTQSVCSGVSICDLAAAPLAAGEQRENQLEKYVSPLSASSGRRGCHRFGVNSFMLI
jgi:hypothetical protein